MIAMFIGPLVLGTAVARTIATSILKPDSLEHLSTATIYLTIISGVGGALAWKLPTWLLGLPSSGSHALLGGLVGAGLAAMGTEGVSGETVAKDVVLPLLVSPILGFALGSFVFAVIRTLFHRANRRVGRSFATMQKPIMIILAASCSSNEAQKSMGVIALILAAGSGRMHEAPYLPQWVVISCAGALALGLATGGWRIVKSVGYGICRLEPVHSFASQFTGASLVLAASVLGAPVSAAQVVASSVMGVGASRRVSGVRWAAAAHIAWAWLLTAPVAAGLGAGIFRLLTHIIVE